MTEVLIPLHGFDKSRVRISPPIKNQFAQNGKEIIWYTSAIEYKDPKDDKWKSEIYIEAPKQHTFGFSEVYPYGLPEDQQTDENIKGWQTMYPLTSLKTAESPAKDEQYIIDVFDQIWELTRDKLIDECSKGKKGKAPGASRGAYLNVMNEEEEDRDWVDAVKPIYSYPKKSEKDKSPDKTKPPRIYIHLLTKGKGYKLKVNTNIYGPGDRLCHPKTYRNVEGEILPFIKWDGLYWGAHGSEKTYGISAKLLLAECNYTPTLGGGPTKRLTPKNTAVDDGITETPITPSKQEGFDDGDNDLYGGDFAESPKTKKKSKSPRSSKKKQESSHESSEHSEEEEEQKPKATKPRRTTDKGRKRRTKK
jgi:hypothetical protein